MKPSVVLRGELYEQAVWVASLRERNARRGGLVNTAWVGRRSRDFHRIGALAERAAAKYLGLPWHAFSPGEAFRELPGDVGRLQVRGTRYVFSRLCVRPRDPEDAIYVHAVVEENRRLRSARVTLVGWLTGAEARQERYWQALDPQKPPCWAIPAGDLHPMAMLNYLGAGL